MIIIELPWPPSVNNLYATINGRRVLSKKGKNYHDRVWFNCREHRNLLLINSIKITREYYPPDNIRRDITNLSKVIDDGLTKARVWNDDCQIVESHDYKRENVIDGRVKVTIEELP